MFPDDSLLVLVRLHAHDGSVRGAVRGEDDKVLARDTEGDWEVVSLSVLDRGWR